MNTVIESHSPHRARLNDLLAIDPGPTQSAYVLLREGTPILNGILDNDTMEMQS